MLIAKVVGTVVSTVKHPAYHGWKLMIVQPLQLEGQASDEYHLAIDAAHAGIGDTVLVCQEGNSTRQVMGSPNAPVRSSIVGIIDSISLRE